jgi:hypothetical protein
MNILYILIIFIVCCFCVPAFAGGELVKLKGIGDSLMLMDKANKEEDNSYQKAKDFINGQDIKEGLSTDYLISRCGKPVAKADNNSRWVYKPSSSTFFRGEKIYLYLDHENRLKSWEQIKEEQ